MRVSQSSTLFIGDKRRGEALRLPIGLIKEGYACDLQVIDTCYSGNPLPAFGVLNQPKEQLQKILYLATAENIRQVWVQGKKYMKNEEIDTVETRSNRLTIGMNEDIPLGQAIVLGLQHVLAMDVYVPPFIIATAVAMSSSDAAGLIQSTF